jgi:hypothetical protein
MDESVDAIDYQAAVLLAPPDAGMSSALISEAARTEMPLAVPECAFEFVVQHDSDLRFTVMPVTGTAGTIEAPGALFERPPTDAQLMQARAALDAIIRRVRSQRPS